MFQVIDGGVTSAKGFKAANTAAGIKYTGRDDMAMIVSDKLLQICRNLYQKCGEGCPGTV